MASWGDINARERRGWERITGAKAGLRREVGRAGTWLKENGSGWPGAAFAALVFGAVNPCLAAEETQLDPSKLPPPAQVQVDFDRDVKPLFEGRCYRCHGPERPKSRFSLVNRDSALKGGEHGKDIVPGNSANSPLVYYVARLVEDMEMPPAGKGEPLTPAEVGLLRAWIDQGAKWSGSGTTQAKTLFSFSPSFAWIGVSGNRAEFREQSWRKEGWSGGLSEFRIQEQSQKGVKFEAEGHALAEQNDYQVKVNLEKPDLGFVHFGFAQYRKYYDDTGGFYEPFGAPALSLGKDLQVDIGRAWFDAGLTLPDWPRIVLGYEYQFKEGAKSSLAWSDLSSAALLPGANPAAVFPGYKDLDERAHILKLDVSHEIKGVRLEDSFQAEFYDLDNQRVEYDPITLGTPATGLTQYREKYNHVEAVNSLRLEKQLKDWLLIGGGYLYSKLDGDAGFSQEALQFQPPLPPALTVLDASDPIVLSRESHIYNLSSLWGPWDGLTLSAGLQNEWTHEEGSGQGLLQFLTPGQPLPQHLYSSERDKAILQEDVGLRYTKLPFTVLFADARFRQEWIDHFEGDQNSPTGTDFLRDTDADIDLKDVRTGFTLSPWTRVSLDASYRHSFERTDYHHGLDTVPVPFDPSLGIDPSNGYPAFFRRRDLETDALEARLVLRPARWVKTTLKYQLLATDYTTVTDPSTVLGLGSGAPLPGGSILAGNYDANIYSLNTTLTPWRRLNFSTTFSYNQSRTVTGVNGRAGVVPYEGDIYSVLSSANVVVSESTDWNVSYTFSRADYRQHNQAESLPLGIEYDRHGVIAGLTRRFGKRMTAALQYGFFFYEEPTSGGARDFTAHAVFASWKVVFD